MNDESRRDVVHTLVTLLVAKDGPKPGRMHCEDLGRQLILKYLFMKDDLGNGYVSHFCYVYIHVYCVHVCVLCFVLCLSVCLYIVCVCVSTLIFCASIISGILG